MSTLSDQIIEHPLSGAAGQAQRRSGGNDMGTLLAIGAVFVVGWVVLRRQPGAPDDGDDGDDGNGNGYDLPPGSAVVAGTVDAVRAESPGRAMSQQPSNGPALMGTHARKKAPGENMNLTIDMTAGTTDSQGNGIAWPYRITVTLIHERIALPDDDLAFWHLSLVAPDGSNMIPPGGMGVQLALPGTSIEGNMKIDVGLDARPSQADAPKPQSSGWERVHLGSHPTAYVVTSAFPASLGGSVDAIRAAQAGHTRSGRRL